MSNKEDDENKKTSEKKKVTLTLSADKLKKISERKAALNNKVISKSKPSKAVKEDFVAKKATKDKTKEIGLTKEEQLRRKEVLQNLDKIKAEDSSQVAFTGPVQAFEEKESSTSKSDTVIESPSKKEEPKKVETIETPKEEVSKNDAAKTNLVDDLNQHTIMSAPQAAFDNTKKEETVVPQTTVENKGFTAAKTTTDFSNKPKKPSNSDARRQNKGSWKSNYGNKSEDETDFKSSYKNKKKDKFKQADPVKREKIVRTVTLSNSVELQDLAEMLSEKAGVLVKKLLQMGVTATPNKLLDLDTAEILVEELGHVFKRNETESLENQYILSNNKEEELIERAPIVTIMGHVDHGKTTLLDTIRKTSVVSNETGGITQHIGAYQVKSKSGKPITFLDTPGHEAFSAIRARGSKITDIVVLVVAADDSVKPQTIEAINHAKHAGVPIIVAVNKIDKPDINVMKVKTELIQHDVIVEEMGGENLCAEISALSNIGIDNLLELILVQAEIMDLKASKKDNPLGTVVEVKTEKGIGILSTVIMERGNLKVGDIFVSGTQTGRVKVMVDDRGRRVKSVIPATPVEISGFNGPVDAGSELFVVPSEKIAVEIVQERKRKANSLVHINNKTDITKIFKSSNLDTKNLYLIIKADTQGSLEAITSSLGKIESSEVELKIINSGVGEISESDIMLAKTGNTVILGFNSRANTRARELARTENCEIRYHSIIYNLIDDVKQIMSGLLDPDIVENIIGYAEIREVFNISKVGKIAGCYVTEGSLKRNEYVRLLRNNVVIHDGVLSELKRFKEDVREVRQNFECGASLEKYNDIMVGDQIECYEKVEVQNTID